MRLHGVSVIHNIRNDKHRNFDDSSRRSNIVVDLICFVVKNCKSRFKPTNYIMLCVGHAQD